MTSWRTRRALMDASTLQPIIPIAGIIAVLFALYLARDVLPRDTGTPGDAGRRRHDLRGRRRLHPAPVHDDRHPRGRRRGRHRRSSSPWSRPRRSPTCRSMAGLPDRAHDRLRLLRRGAVLDGVGHHRHVHQRQGQRAHGVGRPAQPRRGGPGRDARRGRLRLPRRRPVAARRVGHLHPVLDARRRRDRRGGAVPHRRLRLRRLVRGALRPARRRHLHQGRRRRLRPRRQGREGHPRGRPAQRGRDRGPRRRQRRRLRRSWRRPVRVDRRREHRRDDPRRRRLRHRGRGRLAEPRGLDLLPARRPRLRPAGHDRRDLLRPREGDRGPDEHAQPRLLGHDPAVRRRPGASRRT